MSDLDHCEPAAIIPSPVWLLVPEVFASLPTGWARPWLSGTCTRRTASQNFYEVIARYFLTCRGEKLVLAITGAQGRTPSRVESDPDRRPNHNRGLRARPLRKIAHQHHHAIRCDQRIKSPGAIAAGELEKGCASAPPLARVRVLYASQCVIDERTDGAEGSEGTSSRPSAYTCDGGCDEEAENPRIADRSKHLANVDAIEAALASALAAAAAAGRFDVVAQLVREIEARRLARASHVALVN